MLWWFENFMSGRQQCVKVGEDMSGWIHVLSGVSLGSVWAPLLFNLCVDDMPECVSVCDIILCADDGWLDVDGSE